MANDLLASFADTLIDGLRSRTLTSCARWTEYRRIMGEPFPGPCSFDHHPWCREIHNCVAEWAIAQKAAQTGVSETGINRTLYTLAELHRDVLYVLPTARNAADFSKARFSSAVNLSPYLKNLFVETNSIGLKSTGTNNLYIRGSRGDSNLKSVPASLLVLDELDEMVQSQVTLALERLSGQTKKNILAISTPTVPNYGINKLFLESTQEHFFFRCPCCGRKTELLFPDCLEMVGETVSDPRTCESFLKCKECGGKLCHETKYEWLANGTWEATNCNAAKDMRGFYINQLYSATVSPKELTVAYIRGLGDEAAASEFQRSKVGMPFIGDGAKVTDEMIDNCLKPHTTDDKRPEYGGDRVITLGIDQGKFCHYVVCEWFFDKFDNDLNASAFAKVLNYGKFCEDDWDTPAMLMREWQVLAAMVDADPQINEARRFAKKFRGYVWLNRYRRGQSNKEVAVSEEDTGAPLVICDRTNWLSATLGRFKCDPARIGLPRDVSLEFREHIKSLVRTYQKNDLGELTATFVNTGPDHFAHALNYAEIALLFAASVTTGQDVSKFW